MEMGNPMGKTQTQTQTSPVLEIAPQNPNFFGAGAMTRGLIEIDVSDISVDRGVIAKAILRSIRKARKFKIMLVYDVGDDIFQLKPKPMKLSNSQLEQKLNSLGIKYNGETGEITEVPESIHIVEIFDGWGTVTIILSREKAIR